jgi:hypothetical protein
MSLTAYDVKTAKSILPLVNHRVKSNPIEYTDGELLRINCIIIAGANPDGSCGNLYTCIYEMTGFQRELWDAYKGYIRCPSFTKEIPEQGITLIGWF